MDRKKQKRIIWILAILLAISICALAGILIFQAVSGHMAGSVIGPDNIITPDAESTVTEETTSPSTEPPVTEETTSPPTEPPVTEETTLPEETTQPPETTSAPTDPITEETQRPVLKLHSRNTEENIPFCAQNLFPGDQEVHNYCVQVSYKDTVTVKFRAVVQPGYEKLAEVLKCKVILTTTGEQLYDGLMRDMPVSVNHTLRASGSAVGTLSYEITVYLDTSVGNEYQNKPLVADFRWWVDDGQSLEPPSQTGDQSMPLIWLCLSSISLLTVCLLLWQRRKENQRHET